MLPGWAALGPAGKGRVFVFNALMVWLGQVPVMLPILVPAISPGLVTPVPPFTTGRTPVVFVDILTGNCAWSELVEAVKAVTDAANDAVDADRPENVIPFPCNVTDDGFGKT